MAPGYPRYCPTCGELFWVACYCEVRDGDSPGDCDRGGAPVDELPRLETDEMNALYTIGFWIVTVGVTMSGALRLVEFAIDAWFQHTLRKFA